MATALIILIDPWRLDLLAWLHRAEARDIVRELRIAGHPVDVRAFDPRALPHGGRALLRLSDPVMVDAVRALAAAGIAYRGPGSDALERCYDKLRAYQTIVRAGIDCPDTHIAAEDDTVGRPVVIKPRRGSDSIGMRVVRSGPLPARLRNASMLMQPQIFGAELTVSVIDGIAGLPLRLELREGVPYSFRRKYLRRPKRVPLADAALAERTRQTALAAANALGVDWAARVDFIHERATGRLLFLECDAAPLVGPASAFAASLSAGGMARPEQLLRLLGNATRD